MDWLKYQIPVVLVVPILGALVTALKILWEAWKSCREKLDAEHEKTRALLIEQSRSAERWSNALTKLREKSSNPPPSS